MIQVESPSMCFSCKRSSQEVKILDAVKEARPVKICESCAKVEDVIVIRKPTSRQLNDPNKPMSVYNRLRRLSGIDEDKSKDVKYGSSSSSTSSTNTNRPLNVFSLSSSVKSSGGELSEYSIKKRKEIMEKLSKPVNLVEHANWIVQQERRSRRLTLKQLAQELGESETVLRMFEEGKIPDDGRRIAEKLEQFFHVRLVKDDVRSLGYRGREVFGSGDSLASSGAFDTAVTSTRTTLSTAQHVSAALHQYPALPTSSHAIATRKESPWQRDGRAKEEKGADAPSRILKFDKESMKNITLSELQDIKKRREEALGIKKEADELDTGEWKGEVEFVDSDYEEE